MRRMPDGRLCALRTVCFLSVVTVQNSKVWDTVTEEGKTFIKNMLTLDVDERYSSKAALEDPWIANSAASATPVIRGSDSNYLKSLENFHKGNRLQKMSRHIVAMHISDSHIVKLKELFMAMDKNNDGTLTLEEVKQGLSQSGVDRAILRTLGRGGGG